MTLKQTQELQQGYPIYFPLIIAIVIIFLTFLLTKKLKKTPRVVLLTGLSDSGKTAIFTKFIFNKPKKSVTSLKENEATMSGLNLKIIDLPGADRLRSRYWEQYRTKTDHIVFVLDSSTLDTKMRDLSEYLYLLLSDTLIYKNKMKFTIVCNKQDIEGAMDKNGIQALIEKELNAIRGTRKGQLGKTSNEEEDDYLASLPQEEILLDSLKVNLIESSVNHIDQIIKAIL